MPAATMPESGAEDYGQRGVMGMAPHLGGPELDAATGVDYTIDRCGVRDVVDTPVGTPTQTRKH
jgi:hypothetical protein